jgi:putative ATP-binding cassette transporter
VTVDTPRHAFNHETWSRFKRALRRFLASAAGPQFLRMFGLLIAFLIGINALNVLNSYVGRDFISAIENKDHRSFVTATWQYLGVFAVSTAAAVLYRYLEERLALLWRDWQTRQVLEGYLERRNYLRLEQQGWLQNPDQRIAEDIRSFTTSTLSFVLMMLNAAFTVIAFSGVLWSISPLLFGAAVAYALTGSLFTVLLGKRLVGLNVLQLDREAYFRSELLQLRDHAESIALQHGEGGARFRLLQRLGQVVANTRRMISVNRNLGFFTNGYNYLIQIIPALLVAPLFMRGEVEFGVVTQSAMAFTQLMGAFSLAITQFQSISTYAAVITRLGKLVDALDEPDEPAAALEVTGQPSRIVYEDFTLYRPDGRPLIDRLNLSVEPGMHVLVTSTSGHAILGLFQATAGLPCAASGRILRPEDGRLQFVPERPYLPRGSLRERLSAASSGAAHSDAELLQVLRLLDLERLLDLTGGLDAEHDWSSAAGLSEQTRLSVAAVILARPDFVFLDRLSTALNLQQTQRLLQVLGERGIGYLLLGKPGDVPERFDAVLELLPDGRWELQRR